MEVKCTVHKLLLDRKVFECADDLYNDLLELSWAQEFADVTLWFLIPNLSLNVLCQRNGHLRVPLLNQDVLLFVTDDFQGSEQVRISLFSQVLNLSIPLLVVLSLS